MEGKLVTIIGKIYKLNIQNNNRRKLMILDRNNDTI
jgi:hypothetical protein